MPKIRVYKSRNEEHQDYWVRDCPHCPELFQHDYWLTWNSAFRNAQRHVLIHHRYEKGGGTFGARLSPSGRF